MIVVNLLQTRKVKSIGQKSLLGGQKKHYYVHKKNHS